MNYKNFTHLILVLIILLVTSCDNQVDEQIVVYNNDFENENEQHITGGKFSFFNGSTVLGNYNRGSFKLLLTDIPSHDYLWIKFDLYIHDSWDGNQKSENGPDKWFMEIRSDPSEVSPFDFILQTSFSGQTECSSLFCSLQSYPQPFPFSNRPGTGKSGDANGFCLKNQIGFGTTYYQIDELIQHRYSEVLLTCYDSLLSNSNVPIPLCDESWSIDNLNITALTL